MDFQQGDEVISMTLTEAREFVAEKPAGWLTACMSNCKNIGTALAMYAEDHGGQVPQSLSELVPEYLKVIDACPASGVDPYTSTYTSPDGKAYSFHCTSDHQERGVPLGFPSYNSETEFDMGVSP